MEITSMKNTNEELRLFSVENEVKMKSESGFFLSCIDSIMMEYEEVEEEIDRDSLINDHRIYGVSLRGESFFLLNEIPRYEIQCSGYHNGYFIPSGESRVGLFPLEFCNRYLLSASSNEGLMLGGNSATITEISEGKYKIDINEGEKQLYISLNSFLPPSITERVHTYEDEL